MNKIPIDISKLISSEFTELEDYYMHFFKTNYEKNKLISDLCCNYSEWVNDTVLRKQVVLKMNNKIK